MERLIMAKNIFKVPKKQWSRWSELARGVFNRSYQFFVGNQDKMLHPKAKASTKEQWKTTAWNAAWIAADACDDTIPDGVID